MSFIIKPILGFDASEGNAWSESSFTERIVVKSLLIPISVVKPLLNISIVFLLILNGIADAPVINGNVNVEEDIELLCDDCKNDDALFWFWSVETLQEVWTRLLIVRLKLGV